MIVKTLTLAMTALAASALGAGAASAEITRIAAENFNDTAGFITFSEYAEGSVNPRYTIGDVDVRFDGWFQGQSRASCALIPSFACLSGAPTPELALNPVASETSVRWEPIVGDAMLMGSPSGTSPGTGPISIWFSVDQLAVGFDAGIFDAAGSTLISAFARDGALLGTITNTNTGTGIEFLGFATTDGLARIAGVQLSLIGDEPNGFAIDNLRFGVAGQVEVPGATAGAVPEPATWAMMIMGFGLAGMAMRREAGRRRAVSGQARKG